MSNPTLMENDGYDHSILGESQVMMIQFGVGLLLFMTYYAVFLVIDRNHPTLHKIATIAPTTCDSTTTSLRTKKDKNVKKQKVDKAPKCVQPKDKERDQEKPKNHRKCQVVKTNKVSSRSFGLGRRRRSKSREGQKNDSERPQ